MEIYVIKRNGDYKLYESYKIKDAIEKSFNSVTVPYDESIYKTVINQIEQKKFGRLKIFKIALKKRCLKKDILM